MPESNTPINNQPDHHDAPDSENDSDDEDGLLDVDINVMHDSEVDSERIVASVRNILSEHEIDKGAISIAIVGDDKIQELNKHYLQHDYETDVLSFVLDDDPKAKLLNGEIIVSADTAMRVSAEIGVKYSDELLLYVVHGCLKKNVLNPK